MIKYPKIYRFLVQFRLLNTIINMIWGGDRFMVNELD